MDHDHAPDGYRRRVGERLRTIRKQQRLSLQEVERRSDQEFKASVLGAYERGERSISVPRLQRLAQLYHVPVDQLLPVLAEPAASDLDLRDRTTPDAVKIDLTRLEAVEGPEAVLLARYLGTIQRQRQDFNGRVLTVRRDDLRAIACILGTPVEQVGSHLESLGLTLHSLVSR